MLVFLVLGLFGNGIWSYTLQSQVNELREMHIMRKSNEKHSKLSCKLFRFFKFQVNCSWLVLSTVIKLAMSDFYTNTANNFTTPQIDIDSLKKQLKHERQERKSLTKEIDILRSQLGTGNLTQESKAT